MKSDIINNWRPEVRSLLTRLIAAGCKILWSSNGEDDNFKHDDLDKHVTNLTACDEGWLYVETPTKPGKKCVLYLVLGNEPGVIVNDHSVDDTLDKVTDAHYNEWEGRPQPKAERSEIRAAEEGKIKNWTRRLDSRDLSDRNRYEIVSPGIIGRNAVVDNAIRIEATYKFNGSGGKAFGGAKQWPFAGLEVSFQEGEEAKRDALIMRLQETVDQFFGRVS